jgi:hypothetical protein
MSILGNYKANTLPEGKFSIMWKIKKIGQGIQEWVGQVCRICYSGIMKKDR